MTESADHWLQAEAIFHETVGLSEPERTIVLERRCDGNTVLMLELRALLLACEAEEAHGNVAATSGEAFFDRRVGAYTIDRLLGRGGMGAVYLAHRADGQFNQQVAIKIIDMPLATELFRERFRIERQILASLSHPYIARLLDGGVSDDGDLYLTMEYIDGVSITDFCDAHALPVTARLQLFRSVCEAVQCAHQSLVVHRDLKPDNIMVVADGTPRLLDFGTAKLLTQAGPGAELDLTRQGMQTFTPRYTSPEQVLGRPITIASDTYSLGVLLFVLLTREHPYELTEFSTEEMVRVICHRPPRRPSEIRPDLDADLDSIVLKALRKEPQDRYTTTEQLSLDVQAYLQNRPVQARKGSLRYRAGKFARRNRLGLAAACLLGLTLLSGICGVLWQSREANLQRRRAEARSADLRELSNSLLSELNDALKDIPGTTGAQQLLVTRVLQHLDRAAADAHGDRQTELDLIGAYQRLGNVQGNIYYQNLADSKGAVASFDKALALARPLGEQYPRDRDVLRALAATLEAKGEALSFTSDAPGSTANLQDAVAVYDRVIALPGVTPALIFEAAVAYEVLGSEFADDSGMADISAATAAYRRALDMDLQALKIDPGYMPVRRGVPLMHVHLGAVVLDTDPAHALGEFKLAQVLFDALPEDQRRKFQQVRQRTTYTRKEAQADAELGFYAAARSLFAQTVEDSRKLVDADPKNIGALLDLERSQDNWAECEEYASGSVSAESPAEVRKALEAARQHLEEEASTIRQVIRQSPPADQSDLQLDSVLIRISAVEARLDRSPHFSTDAPLVAALTSLAAAANKPQATTNDLEQAASAFLQVGPWSLRRPDLAVGWAQRAAALTHHRSPAALLLLSLAYQADHEPEEAAETAREGLAELPEATQRQPGTHLARMLRSVAFCGDVSSSSTVDCQA